MCLNEMQINYYLNQSVIIINYILNDLIDPLRVGFQKVLEKPIKNERENVSKTQVRFFEDYCNLEQINEFNQYWMNN